MLVNSLLKFKNLIILNFNKFIIVTNDIYLILLCNPLLKQGL